MLKKIKAIITGAVIVASLTVSAGAQQDFTFLSPDGQTVSMSSFRGKVAVVLFGGIHMIPAVPRRNRKLCNP